MQFLRNRSSSRRLGAKRRLRIWSFVLTKSNKQWIWLALDAETKEIVGVHIGDRSRDGAKKRGSKASQSSYDDLRPWRCAIFTLSEPANVPSVIVTSGKRMSRKFLQNAIGRRTSRREASDLSEGKALEHSFRRRTKKLCFCGKETGKTNYIERFNCTMRQRVSRLVRKTLSFSKKIENHVGAIWYFVHYYNKSLPL